MATSNLAIKISALPNIGNAISPNTLIPVVNMSGVLTTQKANMQVAGNLILAGAGTANFAPARLANLAYNVVNAAQPNITSVGTLTELTVSPGNISGANVISSNIIQLGVYLYDNLPLGVPPGTRAFVSDSYTPPLGNFGQRITDGGGPTPVAPIYFVPVYSDGSNWNIG
jgi:hypothetical protein